MIIQFSVDSASVLIQCEREIARMGPAAIGLRLGLSEIRRHLHKIATRAMELGDEKLLIEMEALCLVYPKGDELEGRTI